MRTPLASSIFFLTQIIQFLSAVENSQQILRYCKLMMSQLTFIESFVEDLLDLNQLKDGKLTLAKSVFDPNEVFKLICDIF